MTGAYWICAGITLVSAAVSFGYSVAVVGVTIKDRLKTFGPALTALLNLGVLVWMLLA